MEHLCEREEVLKDLVVSKKDMQRAAPEICQRKGTRSWRIWSSRGQKKHKLIKCEGERERIRTMQGLEVTRTLSPWSGGHDRSSSDSCSSSPTPNTDEAMSASSRIEEMDEVISEASWTTQAKEKERD